MNLFGRVRLGLIPVEKIIDAFENKLDVLEKQMKDCRTLYMDIMKYHSRGRKAFISTVVEDANMCTPRHDTDNKV